jgi:hypothetical protein
LTRRFSSGSASWIGGSQSLSVDRSGRRLWSQVILVAVKRACLRREWEGPEIELSGAFYYETDGSVADW